MTADADLDLSADLARVAEQLGVALDEGSRVNLLRFGRLLLDWAKVINLTGAATLHELGRRHFIDSVAAASVLAPDATLVDVGSGAGLPALPLALIRADLRLTLVEPTAKRVAFLRTAVRELGLGARVTVRSGRVGPQEELSAGDWDAAMARAVWSPQEWVSRARSLVRPGGQILIFCVSQTEAASLAPEVAVVPYAPDRWLATIQTPASPAPSS